MGVESPTYINDLNVSWPLGSDLERFGDDHLRNIKTALKNSFPSMTAPVSFGYSNPVSGHVVPFADSNITFSGTCNFSGTLQQGGVALTAKYGQLAVANTWVPGQKIDGAAATTRVQYFSTAGVNRWALITNSAAESGSNAGSDFVLQALTDAGSFLSNPLSANRASGVVAFSAPPTFNSVGAGGASWVDTSATHTGAISSLNFYANNTTTASFNFAQIVARVDDNVAGTEDGRINFNTVIAGSGMTTRVAVGAGLFTGPATGGDKGAGTVNATELYRNGVAVNMGVTNASAAASGEIGEFLSQGPNTTGNLVSGVTTNVLTTPLSLPAGDWDVWGRCSFSNTGGTSSNYICSVSLTSAAQGGDASVISSASGFNVAGFALTPLRVNVNASTPVYIVASSAIQSGTVTATGTIYARRRR